MMARWASTVRLLTSMKFTITHVQRAPIKEKKKVLGVLCRFFAISVLMHPDSFPVRPDRRDKGQKKKEVSVVKRKHSRPVNDPSGACITLRVRRKKKKRLRE